MYTHMHAHVIMLMQQGLGGTLLRGGLAMMNNHMSHVLEAGEMNCGM